MFVYCKRCGLIKKQVSVQEQCPACELLMSTVPSDYLTQSGTMFASQELRNEFEDAIKQGEEFDNQASAERGDILRRKENKRRSEIEAKVEEYHKNRVKFICPVCHSENLSKISNVGKLVKVSAFGILGAGDIGKKYKCNSCGYRF